MRILAIQDYLRVGGTEAQFLDLTARWSEQGHEVVRLVFRRGGGLGRERGPEPRFLQRFPTPWNWWAPGLRAVVGAIAPDRVICFGRNAHWSFARAFLQERFPGLVATVRTGRPLPAGYRRLLGAAEAVVANSSFAANLGIEQGADPARMRVIENGCRLPEEGIPERDAARREWGLKAEDSVLLVLGSFVPGKAQDRILRIWTSMDNPSRSRLRLWFVGEGPCRKRLERAARKLPGAERVHFWGNRTDVPNFLAAADALVSTSREESSPNALVEGLCAGVPLAATACAGVGELVSAGAGGALFPDSPEGEDGLREWMARLPQERDGRRRLAADYRSTARERFDPDQRAVEYLSLFEELAAFGSVR